MPVVELTSHSVALDAISPRAPVAEALEQIVEANDGATRVAILERLLAALPYEADPLVARAAKLLTEATGEAGISAVARALGLSERQFERRFLARIGVTPKRFAALARFERAIARASASSSLTTAAIDAGYYDQSHFIRDFRRFAGLSPKQYFGRTR